MSERSSDLRNRRSAAEKGTEADLSYAGEHLVFAD